LSLQGLRSGDPAKPVLTVRLFAHRAEVKTVDQFGDLVVQVNAFEVWGVIG